MVANFDLSFQSHGYARVACEVATSIIFPPWFFLLRDTGCCVFPFHTRNSAFPWYCVALLSFQVMLVAVPVFISGVARHFSSRCFETSAVLSLYVPTRARVCLSGEAGFLLWQVAGRGSRPCGSRRGERSEVLQGP